MGFRKTFYRKAPNGQTVIFEFEIKKETIWIDDGCGGINDRGSLDSLVWIDPEDIQSLEGCMKKCIPENQSV